MADFDLTQTDQQVQNILNDGQSAMGAGAQTTLTTEYVMLKDTNGVYHKILKSSFTEAIRDVLAGLLVNNDKGTTINQIAAIASGDFGSVTPANLASVLGGLRDCGIASGDANDKTDTGAYYVHTGNSPFSNLPSGAYGFGMFIVIKTAYIITQIYIVNSMSKPYFRTKWHSGSSWNEWIQL